MNVIVIAKYISNEKNHNLVKVTTKNVFELMHALNTNFTTLECFLNGSLLIILWFMTVFQSLSIKYNTCACRR